MKKPVSVTDWRNRRTTVTDEVAKRAELFSQLESYVRGAGGWRVSALGTRPYRMETMEGSTLPAKLSELGWQVRHLGTNICILANTPVTVAVYELKV